MRGGTRRAFMQQGAAIGALAGLGDLAFLTKLAPASADGLPAFRNVPCSMPLAAPSRMKSRNAMRNHQAMP